MIHDVILRVPQQIAARDVISLPEVLIKGLVFQHSGMLGCGKQLFVRQRALQFVGFCIARK